MEYDWILYQSLLKIFHKKFYFQKKIFRLFQTKNKNKKFLFIYLTKHRIFKFSFNFISTLETINKNIFF